MLMSSCISTIGRICLMNFSIRNYSSGPIIGESHSICVLFIYFFFHVHGRFRYHFHVSSHCSHCPFFISQVWQVPSLCILILAYGYCHWFYCSWLLLMLNSAHMVSDGILFARIVHCLVPESYRNGNLDTPLQLQDTTSCLVGWWT